MENSKKTTTYLKAQVPGMQIQNIYWDRIWMYLEIANVNASTLYLYNGKKCYAAELEKVSFENLPDMVDFSEESKAALLTERVSLYRINITNPGNCKMLPDGLYRITPKAPLNDNDTDKEFVSISTEVAKRIGDFSRVFPFGHEGCYSVNMEASEDENFLPFRLRCNTSKETADSGKTKLKKKLVKTVYNFDQLLFHKKNAKKILLFSDQNEQGSSNLKALANALEKAGYAYDTEYRSLLTKSYSLKDWFSTIKKMAAANYIFLDDHSPTMNWLTLKNTKITQLWHAGVGFKSTGYSRFGMPASPGTDSGHRQYTYGVAGSKAVRHWFSEVWGINTAQVLPAGVPRIDEFLDSRVRADKVKNLLQMYPILQNVAEPKAEVTESKDGFQNQPRLILFAPTYRGKNKKFAYFPYQNLDLEKLYFICNKCNLIFAFKMHPFVKEQVTIPKKFEDRIIDFSGYPDINDLFYLTDILISDYSSDIYEFSLFERPMLFYAFDQTSYSLSRGFHRNYEKCVPGDICTSFEELMNSLEKAEKDESYRKYLIQKASRDRDQNFDYHDTNACARIIDWVIRDEMPDDIRAGITYAENKVKKW